MGQAEFGKKTSDRSAKITDISEIENVNKSSDEQILIFKTTK
jgi:hypothetical protein